MHGAANDRVLNANLLLEAVGVPRDSQIIPVALHRRALPCAGAADQPDDSPNLD